MASSAPPQEVEADDPPRLPPLPLFITTNTVLNLTIPGRDSSAVPDLTLIRSDSVATAGSNASTTLPPYSDAGAPPPSYSNPPSYYHGSGASEFLTPEGVRRGKLAMLFHLSISFLTFSALITILVFLLSIGAQGSAAQSGLLVFSMTLLAAAFTTCTMQAFRKFVALRKTRRERARLAAALAVELGRVRREAGLVMGPEYGSQAAADGGDQSEAIRGLFDRLARSLQTFSQYTILLNSRTPENCLVYAKA
ncbi:hypothetical protein RUND412_004211 [Rhizina undulata]